ncbi:manganese transport transcriptional regulator, partial [Bacillus sp. LL01]
LIGVEAEHIYQDVEGIEHHLSWDAIDRIGDLVQFFQEDERRIAALREVQKKNEEEQ